MSFRATTVCDVCAKEGSTIQSPLPQHFGSGSAERGWVTMQVEVPLSAPGPEPEPESLKDGNEDYERILNHMMQRDNLTREAAKNLFEASIRLAESARRLGPLARSSLSPAYQPRGYAHLHVCPDCATGNLFVELAREQAERHREQDVLGTVSSA